ncbi:hypothetical protein GCM10019998_17450 [Tetragenococcus solitarius]|uniref:Uncharacterized protein n=1 Tax=Tetragenococcus solitarius TaxID=71453 RepID=A0ABP6KUM9_9ENTE
MIESCRIPKSKNGTVKSDAFKRNRLYNEKIEMHSLAANKTIAGKKYQNKKIGENVDIICSPF